MTLSDGKTQIETKERCDDGSDENIASPSFFERAEVMGIDKIEANKTVRFEVALTTKDTIPQS